MKLTGLKLATSCTQNLRHIDSANLSVNRLKVRASDFCNKLWRIDTGSNDDSATQDTYGCIHALNCTKDLLYRDLNLKNIAYWYDASKLQFTCLIFTVSIVKELCEKYSPSRRTTEEEAACL